MTASTSRLSHACLQQAAQWYVLLHDESPTVQQHEQWRRWFEQHAEHQAAWHYVERIGQRFAPLQGEGERQLAGRVLTSSGERQLSRRQSLKGLLMLTGASLLGWGTWRGTLLPQWVEGWSADYSTHTGETREAILADGSHLWLAAISAVDADFGPSRRLLRLRFGELLVDTAKDPAQRPFLVDTEHGRLRALGTRFAVRQFSDATRLNVYSGAVEVCTGDSGERRVVQAGQRVDFTRLVIGSEAPAQTAGESWVRHVLTAEDMPLQQLVDELGRYRHGHLGCDPAVAELAVMGAFPLDDSEQALHLLAAALPVRVQRLTPWWVTLVPA
ncbi:MAG: Protein FecR [Pseudomonas citronellolis]|nr:MAG: Protein FecR [Pseudomonas citronellolis]